jgi:hypothetical protein
MTAKCCAIEGCKGPKVGSIDNQGFCRDHIDEVVEIAMARYGAVRSGMQNVFRDVVRHRGAPAPTYRAVRGRCMAKSPVIRG